ncbi:uncharacterized protein N7487_003519 [Penicillium crustosum]|uniref:uncharacterized protein n=1 Tax=Penicillium crustosum TaxID=36656 RepID=UPI00239CCF5E|nr:uncharacterized protein N7487_010703 [Penicillium crustosum]XP_056725379.1 uncharacterized protein N7487_009069 [Penicillium crustosum]XP_056726993.1 uncharacterized protein N7487_010683 [Penicillium crustosum]XP_056728986.1 uncharacterized protein N7487_003519 [Penicillium crustosum]KAJ5393062.1 hypothetical protein N7487_010703 [Penicillium crustosum]KAJ5394766.1 hypothetical protein N7487_009069 [Penicillium crustosum]KAJ5396380.1 hypothetical protein N7487_010683 [Penicillium crustosum
MQLATVYPPYTRSAIASVIRARTLSQASGIVIIDEYDRKPLLDALEDADLIIIDPESHPYVTDDVIHRYINEFTFLFDLMTHSNLRLVTMDVLDALDDIASLHASLDFANLREDAGRLIHGWTCLLISPDFGAVPPIIHTMKLCLLPPLYVLRQGRKAKFTVVTPFHKQ